MEKRTMDMNSTGISSTLAGQVNSLVSSIAPGQPAVQVAPPAGPAPLEVSPAMKSRDQLNSALEAASKSLKHFSDSLDIQVDNSLIGSVVRVIDPSTNEVIKQNPNEDIVRMAQAIDDTQKSLVKDKAQSLRGVS